MDSRAKIADVAAAGSVTLFGWTTLAQVNEWVHFVAGVVAIIAGVASIAAHFYRWHRRNMK